LKALLLVKRSVSVKKEFSDEAGLQWEKPFSQHLKVLKAVWKKRLNL